MKRYLNLIRFDKQIGTFLLLWPSLVSLVLAEKKLPDAAISLYFFLAVFLARSMGCIINDIADYKFDLYVKRTKNRPLTSHKLSLLQAWISFFIFGFILLGLSVVFNSLTIKLAFIALALMIIYPFSKRFFPLPQLFLGLAFGFSTVMAFSVIKAEIVPESFAVYGFVILWALYYDTIYALIDIEDDLQLKLHSSAIFFGKSVFKALSLMQYLLVIGWIALGYLFKMNFAYYLALIFACLLLYYQRSLIKKNNRASFFKAFSNNNYFGFCWLVSVLIGII